MDFISEIGDIYDYRVNKINVELIEAVAEYVESTIDDIYITEAKKDSLYVKVKKFFVDLIISMKNFINQIKIDVKKKVRDSKNEAKLRKMHKDLKEGKTMFVEVTDIWSLCKYLSSMAKDLKQYTKRIGKMNYTNTREIEEDITKFNKRTENFDTDMEKFMDKKVTVSRQKMIDFVEDEISGRSTVFNTANECIAIIEQMSSDIDSLEKRTKLLGPDVIPKHIGFLRKISIKISTMFKKWISKVVSTFVFLFA